MRAGFKETFKPLIESQESIKKSVDEQQDATIKQLKKINLLLQKDYKETELQLHPEWKKLMKLMKDWLISENYQILHHLKSYRKN